MSDEFFKIKKLNHENYTSWCFRMKSYLLMEGYWDLIETEPPANKDDTWTRRDEIARAKINLLVEDSQIPYIIEAKSAREAWTSLKAQHKECCSKFLTFRSLYNLRLAENGDLEKHIALFTKYADQMKILGIAIPEEHLVAFMLASLPISSYYDFVMKLEDMINLKEIKISFNKVCDMVREENQKKSKKTPTKSTTKSPTKSPTKQYHDAFNNLLVDGSVQRDVENLASSPKSPRNLLRNRC